MSRSRSRSPEGRFENERPTGGFAPRGGSGGVPRSDELFSIKVDGMSLRTNKDDVRAKFERFGEIGDVFFPSDKYTGSSRGFCFVRFFKEDAKEDAVEHYRDGFDFDGKLVRVEPATTRPRPGTENWNPDMRKFNRDGDRGGYGGRGGFQDRNRSFGDNGGRFNDRGPPKNRAEGMFSLKVMDMTLRTTKDDVREKFEKFGEIGDLFFPPDRDTGASRGFCYVRYFKKESLEDAMDEFRDGVDLDGKTCLIEKAMPRTQGGGFNDRGGNYGGRGGGGYNDRFNDRGRDFDDRRRLDRFDDRDRYDDRRGRDRRSPSPFNYRGRRGDSRSPPRRRGRSNSRSPSYDRYKRRGSPPQRRTRGSPMRSRSRSPYRR